MTTRASTRIDHRARIARAVSHLETHLDAPVGPAELARIACFSLHHFHRVFRGVIGESVEEHGRRLRLERAARRLRGSGVDVLAVALEAGYDSHDGFTRAFARHFGVAPSAYRGEPMPRLARPLAAPSRVEVRDEAAIAVATVRTVGGWRQIPPAFERLVRWADSHGAADARLYGVCWDDPDVTAEAQLRFDAAIAAAPSSGDPDVVAATIPAGRYAIAVHRGPYATLSATYLALIGGWFPEAGLELSGDPVIEAYLDDPTQVPEAELRTEVRVRIADG